MNSLTTQNSLHKNCVALPMSLTKAVFILSLEAKRLRSSQNSTLSMAEVQACKAIHFAQQSAAEVLPTVFRSNPAMAVSGIVSKQSGSMVAADDVENNRSKKTAEKMNCIGICLDELS